MDGTAREKPCVERAWQSNHIVWSHGHLLAAPRKGSEQAVEVVAGHVVQEELEFRRVAA